MFLGYNTNGFAHHRLEDTLTILAELGCQSVAITLDYHALNPYDPDLPNQLDSVRDLLHKLKMRSVIETGARFLLDARHKHQPTLVSPESTRRDQRLDFLCRAVDIAQELGSEVVSFWSGKPSDHATDYVVMDRLVNGCRRLCEYAAERGVKLAFETEPGMFIDTLARFTKLRERLGHSELGLTMDIGHLHCQGETPISVHIYRSAELLCNVHIEDMRRGVHDHLMFGDGEIDFRPIMQALREIHYTGGIHVELSRHSHDAVETARRALAFLRSIG